MIKVKGLINRNFKNYAIQVITPEGGKTYVSWDKKWRCTWINKKDALKLAQRIQEIFHD